VKANEREKTRKELVFVWIEDKYREIFKEVGINMHSALKVEVSEKKGGKLRLKIDYSSEKHKFLRKYFPKNAFVSLVVGRNGVGKTSLFDLIYSGMYSDGGSLKNRYFLIFLNEDNDEKISLEIWGASFVVEGERKKTISIEKIKEEKSIEVEIPPNTPEFPNPDFKSIRSKWNSEKTDAFLAYVPLERRNVSSNLSNIPVANGKIAGWNYFLEDTIANLKDYLKDISDEEKIAEALYKWTEYRLLLFALEVFDFVCEQLSEDENFRFSAPSFFVVEFRPDVLLSEIIDVRTGNIKENFSKELKERLEEEERKEEVERFKEVFKWLANLFDKKKLSSNMDEDTLKLAFLLYQLKNDILYSLKPSYLDFLEVLDSIKKRGVSNTENLGSTLLNKFKNFSGLAENFENFLKQLFALQNCGKVGTGSIWICLAKNGIVEDKVLKALKNLVNLARELFVLGGGFLRFSFSPYLSSGHWRLLEVFSYIDSIMNPLYDNHKLKPPRHVLLLLDEPDVYLHPEWQRKFIWLLLKFLQERYGERHYFHVIVTTHSPFLLSDIPTENCVFLTLENGKTKVVEPEDRTLASNIYTLLSQGFFLEVGIGEYIRQKLKEVLKEVKQFKEDVHYFRLLAEEVGDEIIHHKLNYILDDLGFGKYE
jgi:hypothetical protein